MEIIKNPSRDEWQKLSERPHIDVTSLTDVVKKVLDDVRSRGDVAVKHYEHEFDHVDLESLVVTKSEIEEAISSCDPDLLKSIELAHSNITKFHRSQAREIHDVETISGVTCWQKSVAIERVGLYIPGGTAPLFSTVLMLATPASIAGCDEIVLCTPPDRKGKVNPAILLSAHISGVGTIIKAGGVQAIGAMAYGTESVPKVDKIFGPGNQYVVAAKQQVSLHDVSIDMPAGPSEVMVVADSSSNASFVAADLLSQAEHGVDSQVMLLTTDEELIPKVEEQLSLQLKELPRRDIATASLENSKMILFTDMDDAMMFANCYAPEHLILSVDNAEELSDQVVNAGSVFLGHYSCESAGDYASGTNHTLPTNGYARSYSGVGLDSFMKRITFQRLDADGVRSIGKAVETMAHAEGLDGHKNAMTLRLSSLENQ